MWYRQSDQIKHTRAKGFEQKILEHDAECLIRRRLYLQGDYNPSIDEVNRLTTRAMKELEEQYGDYNMVRRTLEGERLAPALEQVIESIIRL